MLERAISELDEAYFRVKEMERSIQSLFSSRNITVFVGEVGSLENRHGVSEAIANLPKSERHKKVLQSLLKRYIELSTRYSAAMNRHQACLGFPWHLATSHGIGIKGGISKSRQAHNHVVPIPVDDLIIDFHGPSRILDGGCIKQLRRHDFLWLGRITCNIQKQVNRNLATNPIKFLLRHPQVARDIGNADQNWSTKSLYTRKGTCLAILEEHAKTNFYVPSKFFALKNVNDTFQDAS